VTPSVHPLWRDISFTHVRWGTCRLEDPIDFARRRVEQNVIGDLRECGYQRQTGRTFRVLLKALEAAYSGMRTLIIAEDSLAARTLELKLSEWMQQVRIPTAGHVYAGGGVEILGRRKGEESIISIHSLTAVAKNPAVISGRLYDLCLYDNAVTDTEYMSPTEDFVRATQRASRACKGSRLSMFNRETMSGDSWKGGDLFKLSGANAVGTLLSIKCVEGIPIGLTVLYNKNLVSLPWDAIDVLEKASS